MNRPRVFLGRRALGTGLAVVLLLGVGGCGKGQRTVIPVRGEVFFKKTTGEVVPAEGAQVEFYLQDDQGEPLPIHPIGKVDKDGSFTVSTNKANDGLPEGEYKVTVDYGPMRTVMGEKRREEGKSWVKEKYRDPKQTPLRVKVTSAGMEPARLEVD